MKYSEGRKIRSHVVWGYSLVMASWVALHSVCQPIYKIGEVALYLDPTDHGRILVDMAVCPSCLTFAPGCLRSILG